MTDLFSTLPMARPMQPSDADAVLAIYGEGIATGHATFNDTTPSFEVWSDGHFETPRIVVDLEGAVAGWAALAPVSARPVYGGVAEASVYVAQAAQGRGVGTALMQALVSQSEAAGFWTLQAGIFPENPASLALHQKSGFKILGVRERIGKMTFGPMQGSWRDVIFLERRSNMVGLT